MSKADWISLIQLIQGANLSQREIKQDRSFFIAFTSEKFQKFDQKFLLNGVHKVIADTIIIIIKIYF